MCRQSTKQARGEVLAECHDSTLQSQYTVTLQTTYHETYTSEGTCVHLLFTPLLCFIPRRRISARLIHHATLKINRHDAK